MIGPHRPGLGPLGPLGPLGHLGPRVSALVDGQLPPAEEERAWAHVDVCGTCHDEVRRQGWVKTRLAGLGDVAGGDTGAFKTALLAAGPPSGDELLRLGGAAGVPRRSTRTGLAALGTGAAGAVALGMLAVVVPPAAAPVTDRAPLVRPIETSRPVLTPIRQSPIRQNPTRQREQP
ncbi:hypothetical protein GCM10009737_20240 [Nocardioides lentus]|uniref:Zinc-finger domain-containing protein n=1 Tax=Nocardioides lentus TaxID=338077 RepID=A0ABN2PF75_9ACTN